MAGGTKEGTYLLLVFLLVPPKHEQTVNFSPCFLKRNLKRVFFGIFFSDSFFYVRLQCASLLKNLLCKLHCLLCAEDGPKALSS